MTADSLSSTFTGRVAAVNPKGFRLDGHDEWLNYSKFAPAIVAPERGQTVTVVVDAKGFVRHVDSVATNGTNGVSRAAQSVSEPSTRETVITRLAVLKAAAEFGAARPDVKSGDVLKIAESWERWVNRAAGADDLVDAF